MIDKNKVKELANEWLEGKEYFLVDATVDEDNKISLWRLPLPRRWTFSTIRRHTPN